MRRLLTGVLLASAALAGFWWLRREPAVLAEAYVRERRVTVWTRMAQVREPAAMLGYGDRVAVLERRNEHSRVRTSEGQVGWVEDRQLMEPALWQRAVELLERARPMPVQARSCTKVASNVRAEPGRTSARIYQFPADVSVEVLARAAAERPPAAEDPPASAGEASAPPSLAEPTKPRREDWLLVRAKEEGTGEVAGWVLGRFLEPDLPAPLRELAAGIHFVAWFELNRVTDVDGEKPQYLAAGYLGHEGQPCDFTLIRVYTWHLARHRYETAYVESHFCGRLPIRLTQEAGLPGFEFAATSRRGKVERRYQFRLNAVRRLRQPPRPAARK